MHHEADLINSRACAAAAARLHYSLGLLRYPDLTYGISNVTLWVLTELTLAYVVFCAPTVPKAFQNSRILHCLFAPISSSKLGRSQRSDNSNANNYSISGQSNHDQRLPKHGWFKIRHDDPYSAPNDAFSSAVPLQNFHASAEGCNPTPECALGGRSKVIRVENSITVSSALASREQWPVKTICGWSAGLLETIQGWMPRMWYGVPGFASLCRVPPFSLSCFR